MSKLPAALVILAASVSALFAQANGEAIYQSRCAGCHEQNSPRVPHRSVLNQMSEARIMRTLNFGTMMSVAYLMSLDERAAVASYLGTPGDDSQLAPAAYCQDRSVRISAAQVTGWNGWSPTANNTRYQTTAAAGLTFDQVSRLKLKWAFGFEGDVIAFSQPTVLDGNVFFGSASGRVHAVDADTGCVKWAYQADGPVRSALIAAPRRNGQALLFGDQIGWFYAVDAASGDLLWKKKVEEHDSTRLTAAAAVHDGVVFVPVASWEETRALNLDYPCCTFRGSVVALNVDDGSQLWKTYFIRQTPQPTGENNRAGTPEWGPSGAGSWSAPTIDAKRGLVYVTTGDNYSEPATDLSDAVVAIEMKTGRIVWAKQTTAGDVFSGACQTVQECPGPDYDYGSSVLLETLPDGRDILLAGQKSGVVYALDPDNGGSVLWQARVGKGGVNGGVQWGMASDGQKVYAAVSDIIRPPGRPPSDPNDPRPAPLDPKTGGGFTALRITDGEKVWYAPPSVCDNKPGCTPAQSAAVTAIPGVVFSGSHDGHIRGFSAEDGRVVWDFDTARAFDTVNGVEARGGSMDGPGPVIVNGIVFVNSGYGRVGAMPGNVLLAFGVE